MPVCVCLGVVLTWWVGLGVWGRGRLVAAHVVQAAVRRRGQRRGDGPWQVHHRLLREQTAVGVQLRHHDCGLPAGGAALLLLCRETHTWTRSAWSQGTGHCACGVLHGQSPLSTCLIRLWVHVCGAPGGVHAHVEQAGAPGGAAADGQHVAPQQHRRHSRRSERAGGGTSSRCPPPPRMCASPLPNASHTRPPPSPRTRLVTAGVPDRGGRCAWRH